MKKRATESRINDLDAQAHSRDLYRMILRIRRAEERLSTLFSDGEVPGFIHLSIGQEAVSAGVMANLRADDTIASTHRGHGHAIAKGMPLTNFFAELLGREDGLCRGRGGSMHVADFSIGMLGANGIVGAGSSIALGSALAHKTLKRDAIAVAFFGDGALAEGLLHETLNLAKLLCLPLLLVCENNGWSEFSPSHRQLSFSFEALVSAYGIPYTSVDGNDASEVADISAGIISEIRSGSGPRALECRTHRVRGHYEGDAQKYRDASELAELSANDPLRIAAAKLSASGVSEDEIGQIAATVDAEIDAAIIEARRSPEAPFAEAVAGVYSRGVS